MLRVQEEALRKRYGLLARVQGCDAKNNPDATRELTVVGPNGKQFKKCAKEAMKLIESNYAKGILDRSDDPMREGEPAEQPKSKKAKQAIEETKQEKQKAKSAKTQQSPPPQSHAWPSWQGYPSSSSNPGVPGWQSSSWGPNPQMQPFPHMMMCQPPWGPNVPGWGLHHLRCLIR